MTTLPEDAKAMEPAADSAQTADLDADPGSSLSEGPADGEEILHTKVCRKCSVQTQTQGNFCPNCGASYLGGSTRFRVNKWIAIAAAAILLVGTGIVVSLNIQHDNQVNAERAVASASASASAAAEQKRQADAAKASASAAASKEAADTAKRLLRKSAITDMEDSILKDAQKRVTEGTLTGPISSASCTALGGGSTDDLTAITGTFQCIAVNKKNDDGSSSGYRFSATINWDTGSYTWHLGS